MEPGAFPQQDGIPTKRCPFCAELILDDAKKCRFCGEFLDPSLRGKYSGGPAHWDGEFLRVPYGGTIRGSHCLICGRPGRTTPVKKKFHHAPLFAVIRETQVVEAPLCAACRTGWTTATVAMGMFAVLGVVGCPVLFGWLGSLVRINRDNYAGWGVFAGFMAWVWGMVAIQWLWVRRRQAICKKIDEYGAVLRLPNATLLQTAWEQDKTA